MQKTIILNWKHHWVENWQEYCQFISQYPQIRLIAPPPLLGLAAQYAPGKIGSSYITDHNLGSFTGACGPEYLKKIGVNLILIGHVEQRKYFLRPGDLKKQIICAKEAGMEIILCVGEREPDHYEEELLDQLKVLDGISFSSLTLAYEPHWAVGTGRLCPLDHLNKIMKFLKMVTAHYGVFQFLYGGSICLNTSQALMSNDYLDGLLLGRMSLSLEHIENMMSLPAMSD